MSAAAGAAGAPAGVPRGLAQAKAISLIASGALAFGVFLSGFVINEPAPYELFMVGLIALWMLFGLRLSRHAGILFAILGAFNVGGILAMTQMPDLYETPLYLAVSVFLAMTSVFFLAVLEADHGRYLLIFRAWVAAAIVTGCLGIAGYFNLFPGADVFTRFDRATGAFEDPNVFGPFLALPAIFLMHRLMTGNPLTMPGYALAFLVIVAGIFFSFSRGAWGLFTVASILLTGALFLQSDSGRFRLRIVAMAVLAFGLLVTAILVALQLPGVSDFFAMRAQLVQSYDGGEAGRFARFADGFILATERPLGIGALEFGRIFGEDTHNIWLKALMDYGWIGFAAWVVLVVWTIAGGFRILFRDRPWQPYLLCSWVVFIGHIGLGTVIDMDHWRHFYALVGLIWGAMALEARHEHGLARNATTGSRPAPGQLVSARTNAPERGGFRPA